MNNINKEISELIKNKGDNVSIDDLRNKYPDDKIFDTIQEAYYEKLLLIRKRAIKFTKYIEKKYITFNYPLHIILNKALKYKKKYNLDDETFELFRQYYQKNLNTRNNTNKYDILIPNTNMAKIFGNDPFNNKIYINDKDHKIIKEIINLYNLNKINWQQVTLQSITYSYHNYINLYKNKGVDEKISNFSSFIHPVIAAMFIPKIDKFDEYFLFTNLAYIIKCKILNESITTYHNYIMLYNLIYDPTDIICNIDSPLKDILNRIYLQVNLWKNVIRLRQGGFYDTYNSFVAIDLMLNIDNCKISTYDTPDLLMIGDENVIIRRLLNSLSFRCATIYSIPTNIPLFTNQINIQINTLNIPINYTQVSKVPIIYIKLLSQQKLITNKSYPEIQDFLSTTQTIMYNGKLESKMLSVVDTNGVLVIVIPRRTFKPFINNIYNFSNMPHHTFGLEMLNDTILLTNIMLEYGNNNSNNLSNKLFIKSIVTLKEEIINNNKFIYGSKTWIVNYNYNYLLNSVYYNYNIYDPLNPIKHNKNGIIPLRRRIINIDNTYDLHTKQTILIYNINSSIKNKFSNNILVGGTNKTQEDEEKNIDKEIKLLQEIVEDNKFRKSEKIKDENTYTSKVGIKGHVFLHLPNITFYNCLINNKDCTNTSKLYPDDDLIIINEEIKNNSLNIKPI